MVEFTDPGRADTQRVAGQGPVQLTAPIAEGEERYHAEGVLGKGGMGIVSARFDRRVGRRVAAKELRPDLADDAQVRARFLREAQVQGQLEHPAVVPVYDLGVQPDGTPYFTMKNVRGETLRDIIDALRAGDPDAARKHTRHRLLNAFASVCLAVDYSHRRGILHRDLKPANLMLGDFGEVYVLDWGVAKITGAPEVGPGVAGDTPSPTAMTHVGALLGTPGYMAPEQIEDPSSVGPAADVYALGAILFELLAMEPLHTRASVRETFESTRLGADARASARAPDRDVPPELDGACVRATALDPAARFASVRELHERVERYLEGERDVSLRRQKSAEHARAAGEAARRVREGGAGGGADALEARRRAMQEIGRALALDPTNVEAISTMVALLSEPPEVTPPEIEFEMAKAYRRDTRWIGGIGAVAYPMMIAFLPFMLWMGIRQPFVIGGFFGLLAVSAGLSLLVMRARVPPTSAILVSMLASTAAFALSARVGSPFVLAPMGLAINATGYAIFVERRQRLLVTAAACLAFLVPLGLELTGVLPRTFALEAGQLVILPTALALPPAATLALVVVASIAGIIMASLVVGHIRDRLSAAERRIYLYAWHLREFVPAEARRATDPTS